MDCENASSRGGKEASQHFEARRSPLKLFGRLDIMLVVVATTIQPAWVATLSRPSSLSRPTIYARQSVSMAAATAVSDVLTGSVKPTGLIQNLAPPGFAWGPTFAFDDDGNAVDIEHKAYVQEVDSVEQAAAPESSVTVVSWYDSGVRLSAPEESPWTSDEGKPQAQPIHSIDELVIQELLGKGTQSEVLLGDLPGYGPVAVKLGLKLNAVAREAAVLSAMNDIPGFPMLLHHEPESDLAGVWGDFLVMGLLGSSLEGMWETKSKQNKLENMYLTGPMLLKIGRAVLRLLRQLHLEGFVHNDVKPANILLGEGPSSQPTRVHLIDFGTCTRVASHADIGAARYVDGKPVKGAIGTTMFASVAADDAAHHPTRPVDDIESLVYNLLCLAAGGLPWEGQSDPVASSMKRELLASSGAISKLIHDLPCASSAKAIQTLWSEVRRCRTEDEEGLAGTGVDYEACLAALGGGSAAADVISEDDFLAALDGRPSNVDSDPVGKVVPVGTAAERQAEGAAGSS